MIGIVVGLKAEARLARGLGCPIAVGGGGAAGAREASRRLIAEGATALISFGLAGGLAPDLLPGSLVIAADVIDGQGTSWQADPALSARLGDVAGSLFAAVDIIATAHAKRALWSATGALAADIESGAVAAAGVPFAILRAVCDPAHRDLPPAAQTSLDAAGRIQPIRLLQSVIRHPTQIGALIELGQDAALARRALLRQVDRIGPLSPH
jgi:adenosylhomocysteine nucleosidase